MDQARAKALFRGPYEVRIPNFPFTFPEDVITFNRKDAHSKTYAVDKPSFLTLRISRGTWRVLLRRRDPAPAAACAARAKSTYHYMVSVVGATSTGTINALAKFPWTEHPTIAGSKLRLAWTFSEPYPTLPDGREAMSCANARCRSNKDFLNPTQAAILSPRGL